jgi:acetylornithine deacetylase
VIDETTLGALRARVDANLAEQIEISQELVRIPSVTGEEGPAQAFMAERYREAGLQTEMRPVAFDEIHGHPAYSGLREEASAYAGRPNVIGRLPGSDGGRSLLLGGHVDVVSPEPSDGWSFDPWAARIAGDRLYGRGANDMKAGLVANLMAVRALLEAGVELRGDLILHSTIEEEAGGGGGTLALFDSGSIGDGVIITEPTNLGLRIGSGGVLYFRIVVEGRTAHAGNAHLGESAILHALPVCAALDALDHERGARRAPLFEAGSFGRSCHLNLGVLRAGDWPSTVPGRAVLEGRLGYLPDESRTDVLAQLERVVSGAAVGDAWLEEHPPAITTFGFRAEPWLEPEDSPLLSVVREATCIVLGSEAETHARASAVDNRFAPLFGKPTLCIGTRGQGNHGTDEYVELSSLGPLTLTLAVSALLWCGAEAREHRQRLDGGRA